MPKITFLFNVQVMHDPLPKWGEPKYDEFRAACGGKFPVAPQKRRERWGRHSQSA